MKLYAKLVSEEKVEMAPSVKGSITNYNSENNEQMLFNDGYKELILSTHETGVLGHYKCTYKLEDNKIKQEWLFTPYTREELETLRSEAYRVEVDPITSHIQRLRDEEPSSEEIDQLLAERLQKVNEIKSRYPYPEENTEIN